MGNEAIGVHFLADNRFLSFRPHEKILFSHCFASGKMKLSCLPSSPSSEPACVNRLGPTTPILRRHESPPVPSRWRPGGGRAIARRADAPRGAGERPHPAAEVHYLRGAIR